MTTLAAVGTICLYVDAVTSALTKSFLTGENTVTGRTDLALETNKTTLATVGTICL